MREASEVLLAEINIGLFPAGLLVEVNIASQQCSNHHLAGQMLMSPVSGMPFEAGSLGINGREVCEARRKQTRWWVRGSVR